MLRRRLVLNTPWKKLSLLNYSATARKATDNTTKTDPDKTNVSRVRNFLLPIKPSEFMARNVEELAMIMMRTADETTELDRLHSILKASNQQMADKVTTQHALQELARSTSNPHTKWLAEWFLQILTANKSTIPPQSLFPLSLPHFTPKEKMIPMLLEVTQSLFTVRLQVLLEKGTLEEGPNLLNKTHHDNLLHHYPDFTNKITEAVFRTSKRNPSKVFKRVPGASLMRDYDPKPIEYTVFNYSMRLLNELTPFLSYYQYQSFSKCLKESIANYPSLPSAAVTQTTTQTTPHTPKASKSTSPITSSSTTSSTTVPASPAAYILELAHWKEELLAKFMLFGRYNIDYYYPIAKYLGIITSYDLTNLKKIIRYRLDHREVIYRDLVQTMIQFLQIEDEEEGEVKEKEKKDEQEKPEKEEADEEQEAEKDKKKGSKKKKPAKTAADKTVAAIVTTSATKAAKRAGRQGGVTVKGQAFTVHPEFVHVRKPRRTAASSSTSSSSPSGSSVSIISISEVDNTVADDKLQKKSSGSNKKQKLTKKTSAETADDNNEEVEGQGKATEKQSEISVEVTIPRTKANNKRLFSDSRLWFGLHHMFQLNVRCRTKTQRQQQLQQPQLVASTAEEAGALGAAAVTGYRGGGSSIAAEIVGSGRDNEEDEDDDRSTLSPRYPLHVKRLLLVDNLPGSYDAQPELVQAAFAGCGRVRHVWIFNDAHDEGTEEERNNKKEKRISKKGKKNKGKQDNDELEEEEEGEEAEEEAAVNNSDRVSLADLVGENNEIDDERARAAIEAGEEPVIQKPVADKGADGSAAEEEDSEGEGEGEVGEQTGDKKTSKKKKRKKDAKLPHRLRNWKSVIGPAKVSNVYAIVEMMDDDSFARAASDIVRIFGLSVEGRICHIVLVGTPAQQQQQQQQIAPVNKQQAAPANRSGYRSNEIPQGMRSLYLGLRIPLRVSHLRNWMFAMFLESRYSFKIINDKRNFLAYQGLAHHEEGGGGAGEGGGGDKEVEKDEEMIREDIMYAPPPSTALLQTVGTEQQQQQQQV